MGSLCDLLAACESGTLVDLPGMRPHQRGQVVTAFAILLHLATRYGAGPISERVAALGEVLGPMPLYPGDGQPGFFQAAFPSTSKEVDRDDWWALDPLFYGVGHAAKGMAPSARSDEAVVYALISSGDRIFVKGNPNGPRQTLLAAYPSEDGTIGSEVRCLARVYDELAADGDDHGGFDWKRPSGPRCHLGWLVDGSRELRHRDIAWPPLDTFRHVRVSLEGEVASARILKSVKRCSDALKKAGVADPHSTLR